MSYPYFLGPDEHRLFSHYRTLNGLAFVLMPLVFVLNEFLVRPHLNAYRELPEGIWAITVLLLSAQIPTSSGTTVMSALIVIAGCYAVCFFMLPKWGFRPSQMSMKSGLPTYIEYKSAVFFIQSTARRLAFFVWHSLLMRVSFFLGVFIPTMVINLFRSLS